MAKQQYIAEVEFRIAGIPCLIGIIDYECQPGSFSYNADSDWDYYGYSNLDYDVLDRKGYKADWLAKKITSQIEVEIEEAVEEYFREEACF